MDVTGYSPFVTLHEKKLPFYVTTVGNPKRQRIIHRPLGIEDYMILYTVKGKGICFIEGDTYELEQGMLIYFPPDTPHEYRIGGCEWETLYITFNGVGMHGFLPDHPTVCKIPERISFKKRHEDIHYYKGQPHLYQRLSLELYSLLIDLCECMDAPTPAAEKQNHKLTLLMHQLSENNNVQLCKLADNMGITEEHLCRIFKKYTGYRPLEYANLLKIQKAKHLLKSTDMTINEISSAAGFESHSYFTLLFKKYVGSTPTQYKRNG